VLTRIAELSQEYRLRCINVFHAGDGNLHPLILFDANVAGELERTEASAARSSSSRSIGGTITGEHGVGYEKINSRCATQFSLRRTARLPRRQGAPSIRTGLLNPGRACRPCGAAPSSAACTCMAARSSSANWSGCDLTEQLERVLARASSSANRSAYAAAAARIFMAGRLPGTSSTRTAMPESSATSRPSWWSPPAAARRWRSWSRRWRHGNSCSPASRRASATATVGGAVAAGLSGPRRAAVGSLRDFVLGVRIMDGEGRVLKFGGEVMKNVAGLRRIAPDDGGAGHPGADPRGLAQGAAAAGGRCHACASKCRRTRRMAAMNRWAGQPLPLVRELLAGRCADHPPVRRAGGRGGGVRQRLGGEALDAADEFWNGVREQQDDYFFAGDAPLWRLSLPSKTPPLQLPGDAADRMGRCPALAAQ
jgi:hypothetical protein